MENMMFKTAYAPAPLWQVLQQTAKIQGAKAIIAEDINHRPMTFDRLLIGSMVLGNQFTRFTSARENVGLMLPNTLGCLVSFFALQSIGRVPAMINYSAGISAILSCVQTAQIKNLITSRVFIERGRLEGLIEALEPHLSIIYLEDIQKTITLADKIRAKLTPPALFYKQAQFVPNDPAVVLFTSGSEGNPKGVVLSHANITANIQQLSSRVDFNRQDIVFNALPMFHSFGLTGGALLPVLSGIRTFLYPSPLHYRIVPEMVYRTNATIMFGTNTFLKGYARMADAYDFYRMRYIFAGAERVEDETRRLYLDRFGVKILEGYGATETSPVLAVNSAMHFKAGTVGRLLPAIQTKLEPVAGVVEGAKLLVKGDNVMLGYYLSSAAGIIQPPVDGWHDTGDIVSIDSEGFVKIVGRAKRFAKIGAEMVSLSAVEQLANACWEEDLHAAISTSDPKKGEKIILFTTQKDAKRVALAAYAQQHGINNLSVPSEVIMLEKMPLLGSGKTDYTELQKITEA
jgi:acyl-[acyl-carrier-protein]-phospholipid O-acyltransferase/long-chain-fatty-acid--[acyl-carrier-protein] ligase